MVKFKHAPGVLHIGILVLVIFSLLAVTSIVTMAKGQDGQRPLTHITDMIRHLAQGNNDNCNQSGASRGNTNCQQSSASQNCGSNKCNLGNEPGPCYPWGDVNNDGKVTNKDSDAIIMYLQGITPPVFFKDRADVDASGSITLVDAARIRQYIGGDPITFPVCPSKTSAKGPCPPLGDANGDGVVNGLDIYAITLSQHGQPPAVFFKDRADVNHDGAVFSADAEIIRQFLDGKIKTFPGCTPSSNPPSPAGRGPCYPIGDVNGDGAVNDLDAQAILNYVANITPARFLPERADVNRDGSITAVDAQLIRQYLAGYLTRFFSCPVNN